MEGEEALDPRPSLLILAGPKVLLSPKGDPMGNGRRPKKLIWSWEDPLSLRGPDGSLGKHKPTKEYAPTTFGRGKGSGRLRGKMKTKNKCGPENMSFYDYFKLTLE